MSSTNPQQTPRHSRKCDRDRHAHQPGAKSSAYLPRRCQLAEGGAAGFFFVRIGTVTVVVVGGCVWPGLGLRLLVGGVVEGVRLRMSGGGLGVVVGVFSGCGGSW